MISRRSLVSSLAVSSLSRAQNATPRNVILIVADDLGLHTGAYGDAFARTPNLDRLAAEGVRFTQGYCTTASCSASRSVLFTGLQNHANGQYGHAHAEHHFSLLPHVQPMPKLLKNAGYRTGLVGKFHVSPPAAFGFDLLAEGGERNVQAMAGKAASFIESCGQSPFFLHYAFGDPHRATQGFANDRAWPGVTKTRFDARSVPVPSFLPDNAATRGELAEYYEAANRLDQGVGMLLDVLKRSGQMDNTLLLFLSDNGMAFPNAKTNLYDAGARLPLLVRSPRQAKRGLVNNAMVSWADITPTILDWCGAAGPGYPLHGRSFLPVLEQENPAGWDQVYFSHTFHEVTMHYPMRGTRTRQFKYLRNLVNGASFPHASDLWASAAWQSLLPSQQSVGKRPLKDYLWRAPEELYDVRSDPDEVKNLAGDPSHAGTLQSLRRATQEFRKRTKDPWLINDDYILPAGG